ncbi:MAG TPA: 1-acyl-sn-glycerol-3-phosphate acyltransferase, partial [bacterium]
MQGVVVAEPYRFVPPAGGTLVPRLIALWLPGYLRRSHGVVAVRCRGVERLRASLAAGHGIMLAPNHCRPCDPMVLGLLAREAGCLLHIMASWHLFKQGRLQTWLLRHAGVFSVYREGMDRESLACAVRILAGARRPLVLFPEGAITRHNDLLNHLMEGTAFIARTAAKQRAAAGAAAGVVVHPVAIRYVLESDLEAAVAPVLTTIERRLSWRPQESLPLIERVLKTGGAMLALKEIEHLGAPQAGEIGERVARLVDGLLEPLEAEWAKGKRERDVVGRVKLLRAAILPDLVGGELAAAERDRRWRQLEDCALAQALSFYRAGYFTPAPTPERVLETVERFEEDTTGTAPPPHALLRAVVDVGEALPVAAARERGPEGDPLMAQVRASLE